MIDKKNFSKTHIESCHKKYPKVNITSLEMTIYAFGLLDVLVRNNVDFIFKGGTSLMLLLKKPKRVSTDIDIIVKKGTDFDKLFKKIRTEFPFFDGEERGKKSKKKEFRHFLFAFKGPISNHECHINLDVAFESNPYSKLLKRDLKTDFLSTTGKTTTVNIPSIESILGDKLTAFAPNTIGVNPFKTSLGSPIDNRLQVIKQFYDIATLYKEAKDYKAIKSSYKKCYIFENNFRKTKYTIEETLLDTFNSAASIASGGKWINDSDFFNNVAKAGIQGLATNVFDGKYNQVVAANDAADIMLLSACLIANKNPFINNINDKNCDQRLLRCFKTIQSKEAFIKIKKSLSLIHNIL